MTSPAAWKVREQIAADRLLDVAKGRQVQKPALPLPIKGRQGQCRRAESGYAITSLVPREGRWAFVHFLGGSGEFGLRKSLLLKMFG